MTGLQKGYRTFIFINVTVTWFPWPFFSSQWAQLSWKVEQTPWFIKCLLTVKGYYLWSIYFIFSCLFCSRHLFLKITNLKISICHDIKIKLLSMTKDDKTSYWSLIHIHSNICHMHSDPHFWRDCSILKYMKTFCGWVW